MKVYSVTDFTSGLASANNADSVWTLTVKFFDQYGLDGLVYLNVDGDDFTLKSTLPTSWHQHYIDSKYQEIDSFAETCCTDFSLMATGEANLDLYAHMSVSQKKLVREAGETGFKAGFSSPFRLLSSKGFGGWNLMSSEGKKENDIVRKRHGDILHLATFCAHQVLANTSVQVSESPLSSRETECLQWLACGLRTQEIAHKMGLKPVTIEFHFRNAREKLFVRTREQALAKTIFLGYIEL